MARAKAEMMDHQQILGSNGVFQPLDARVLRAETVSYLDSVLSQPFDGETVTRIAISIRLAELVVEVGEPRPRHGM